MSKTKELFAQMREDETLDTHLDDQYQYQQYIKENLPDNTPDILNRIFRAWGYCIIDEIEKNEIK